MSPISTERLRWIEERLFILARTAQTLRREGLVHAHRYFTDSSNEAHAIAAATMQAINQERLSLMMERKAIEEYLQEQHPRSSDGS